MELLLCTAMFTYTAPFEKKISSLKLVPVKQIKNSPKNNIYILTLVLVLIFSFKKNIRSREHESIDKDTALCK